MAYATSISKYLTSLRLRRLSLRTIIAGSRYITDAKHVLDAIAKFKAEHGDITVVVCGECKGPDLIGKLWAKQKRIPVNSFEADWSTYGKSAGPIRNKVMAENADALIERMGWKV